MRNPSESDGPWNVFYDALNVYFVFQTRISLLLHNVNVTDQDIAFRKSNFTPAHLADEIFIRNGGAYCVRPVMKPPLVFFLNVRDKIENAD